MALKVRRDIARGPLHRHDVDAPVNLGSLAAPFAHRMSDLIANKGSTIKEARELTFSEPSRRMG